MHADEIRLGRKYEYRKAFWLIVVNPNGSKNKTISREFEPIGPPVVDDPISRPKPYVIDFDSKGLMTVGWTD